MKIRKIAGMITAFAMLMSMLNVQAVIPEKTVEPIAPETRGNVTRTDNGDGSYTFAISENQDQASLKLVLPSAVNWGDTTTAKYVRISTTITVDKYTSGYNTLRFYNSRHDQLGSGNFQIPTLKSGNHVMDIIADTENKTVHVYWNKEKYGSTEQKLEKNPLNFQNIALFWLGVGTSHEAGSNKITMKNTFTESYGNDATLDYVIGEIKGTNMKAIINKLSVKYDTDTYYITPSVSGDTSNAVQYVAGYGSDGSLLFAKAPDAAVEMADRTLLSKVKMFIWDKNTQKPVATPKEVNSDSFTIAGEPGSLLNVKMAGKSTDAVYGIPSIGVDIPNLYAKYFSSGSTLNQSYSDYTFEDLIADLENPQINPIISNTNAYAAFNDRVLNNTWRSTNNVYGDQFRFAVVKQDSVLVGDKVTKLFKPSTDPQTYPQKAYEFDVSKDASVYITVPSRSTYIEGLDKGWEYENNSSKYNVKHASYKKISINDANGQSKDVYMPAGGTVDPPFTRHTGAYYKHVRAGEHVEIPVFDTTQSYYETLVYVVWDECNNGYGVYGAEYLLDDAAVSIKDFDTAKTQYTITLPQDTSSVPELNMIATAGSNVQITSDEDFDETGLAVVTVTADISEGVTKTYTFNFYKSVPEEIDTRLKAIYLDDELLDGFDMYKNEYSLELPYGSQYPAITAQTNASGASCEITQNNGECILTVTSEDTKYTEVYKVKVTILDYIPAEGDIMPIKDNRRSIVTIVHDDGNIDTVSYMNDEFEKNNLKGTIAIIAKYANNSSKASWQKYLDTGRFNMANHSYNHIYWGQTDAAESGTINGSAYSIEAGTMTNEIITSGQHLRNMFPKEKVNCFVKPGFAYPSGMAQVSAAAKKMIQENYIAMRNTGGQYLSTTGLNSLTPADYYNINSLMVYYDDNVSSWKALTDKAIANNAWAVYLFHGIFNDADNNRNGVPKSKATELFEYIGTKVSNKDVWCTFFDEAVMYTKEVQTAQALVKDYTKANGNSIGVSVTDELDNSVYDCPVTVKVAVPDTWSLVELVQGGRIEKINTFTEDGKTYAYANVVPDSGDAVMTPAE